MAKPNKLANSIKMFNLSNFNLSNGSFNLSDLICPGIYQIQCMTNSKIYIGEATVVIERLQKGNIFNNCN